MLSIFDMRADLFQVFYPEIVDIYDKKNMPKAIYCLHALSIYLHKRFGSKFPTMLDVSHTASFTRKGYVCSALILLRLTLL